MDAQLHLPQIIYPPLERSLRLHRPYQGMTYIMVHSSHIFFDFFILQLRKV